MASRQAGKKRGDAADYDVRPRPEARAPAARRQRDSPPSTPPRRKKGGGKRRSGFGRLIYWGAVAAAWCVMVGLIGVWAVRLIGALMNVAPIFPALILGGAMGMVFGVQSGEERQYDFTGAGTVLLQSSENTPSDPHLVQQLEGQVRRMQEEGVPRGAAQSRPQNLPAPSPPAATPGRRGRARP